MFQVKMKSKKKTQKIIQIFQIKNIVIEVCIKIKDILIVI